MSLLSPIITETAENFGLGNKSGPLVARTAVLMFDPKRGGLKGFLERMNEAGLEDHARSWLSRLGEPRMLDGRQLELVAGAEAISQAGRELGLANARVKTAMGAVAPVLARLFVHEGVAPASMPPQIQAFLESDEARLIAPVRRDMPRYTRRFSPERRAIPVQYWGIGVAVLLATSGFMAWQLWKEDAKSRQPATKAQPVPAAPVTPLQSGRPTASVFIRNNDGRYEYSGEVADSATRDLLANRLKAAFGDAVSGGSARINPALGTAEWIGALDRILPLLVRPGLDVRLEGNLVQVGGWLADGERQSVLGALKTALGSGFKYGYLRDEGVELAQESHDRTLERLAALPYGFKAAELVAVLNQWIVNFDEGSETFPASARDVAALAAKQFRAMAQPALIEITAYTGPAGNPSAELLLTQGRASAVRDELVRNGASPHMLQSKGHGGANPLVADMSPYARFRNRRIEFVVIRNCESVDICDAPASPQPPAEPAHPVNVPDAGKDAGRTPANSEKPEGTGSLVFPQKPTRTPTKPAREPADGSDAGRVVPARPVTQPSQPRTPDNRPMTPPATGNADTDKPAPKPKSPSADSIQELF